MPSSSAPSRSTGRTEDAAPASEGGPAAAAPLHVSVAYSPRAGVVDEVALTLAAGATLADALRASGLRERHPSIDADAAGTGIWGVRCDAGTRLRERDRVEIYRALPLDPKEARRQRGRAQRDARRRAATG